VAVDKGLQYTRVENKKWTDLNNVEETDEPTRVNSKAIGGAQLYKPVRK